MKSFGCQEWPWVSFWRGQGQEFQDQMLRSMQESRDAGFDSWEGTLPTDAAALETLGAALATSGLSLPSLYANARLHGSNAPEIAAGLLNQCRQARSLGFSILVLNPEPIDWSSPEEKSDVDLQRQALAMRDLQTGLETLGLGLAYHIHSSEMRSDGRELMAMLAALPDLKLCMEAEWLLRGGWSARRSLEFIHANGAKMISAHLRQCRDQKPLIELDKGDFDYLTAAEILKKNAFSGPLVYEGYRESPVDFVEMRACLRHSLSWMKSSFRDLL